VRTDGQTYKPSTVTLTVHVRRVKKGEPVKVRCGKIMLQDKPSQLFAKFMEKQVTARRGVSEWQP
jgi:hypothetical protein